MRVIAVWFFMLTYNLLTGDKLREDINRPFVYGCLAVGWLTIIAAIAVIVAVICSIN